MSPSSHDHWALPNRKEIIPECISSTSLSSEAIMGTLAHDMGLQLPEKVANRVLKHRNTDFPLFVFEFVWLSGRLRHRRI